MRPAASPPCAVPSLMGQGRPVREEVDEADPEGFAWVSAVGAAADGPPEEIQDIGEDLQLLASLQLSEDRPLETVPQDDDDEIPDLEDFADDDNLVVNDPAAFRPPPASASRVLLTRTFDVSITYDKYYQTPRVWVTGYAEDGSSLPPKKVLLDVSIEHAGFTVTTDTPHPLLGLPMASIHPCRHAHVMKRIIQTMMGTMGRAPRVDQYVVIFLKFLSTVLPTIDYDHTMALE